MNPSQTDQAHMGQGEAINSSSPWRLLVMMSLVAYALPSYFFFTLPDSSSIAKASDLIFFGYVLLTIIVFSYATYRTRQHQPALYSAWLLLTLSMILLQLYVGNWLFVEFIQEQTAPASTGAQFLLISNGLFLVGLYRIPRIPQTRLQMIRQAMDTLTIYIGALLLFWIIWINPLLAHNSVDGYAFGVASIYLLVHLTMILTVISHLFRAQLIQPRKPLFLFLGSTVCLFLADLVLATAEPLLDYQPGGVIDYLNISALILGCAAAALQSTAVAKVPSGVLWHDRRSRYIGTIQVALPPILLIATFILMIPTHSNLDERFSYLMAAGIGIMFILVSVRQVLTLLENTDLTFALRKELLERQHAQIELQQVNETLEQHVAERTKELLVLNEQLRTNESKLRFDAFHDKLTGLPNRAAFIHHLESALQVSQTDPTYRFAVLFLDFDGFKVVNDSLGHWLGDELLIALAHRLREDVPVGNLVARLGGDEFLVLLEHFADDDEPLEIAENIQQKLRHPFSIRDYRLHTSASIGIVLKDEFHTTAGDLLRDADIAMYRAKEKGKARCVLFDTTMRAQAVARLKLENALRTALVRSELHLVYQPICHVKSGCVTGFEALARWHSPEHGDVSPGQFIPIAEETGLIIPLGEWVLEEACGQLKAWQVNSPGAANLTISVNISAQQLYQGNLTSVVKRVLQKVDLAPTSLKLEITESIFMEDVEAAIATFSELRLLGVQLQVDDFGTGYSSFNYLHRLPITTLKIDKSFIDLLHLGGQHVEIVRTIATLAHNLQLTVIAEGVETEEQLCYIRTLACEEVQGYLISRPLLYDAAETFIRTFTTNRSLAFTPIGAEALTSVNAKLQTIKNCGQKLPARQSCSPAQSPAH